MREKPRTIFFNGKIIFLQSHSTDDFLLIWVKLINWKCVSIQKYFVKLIILISYLNQYKCNEEFSFLIYAFLPQYFKN